MIEALIFIAVFLGGLVLGVVFFGGLWWTVQKGMSSLQPALWFLGSYFARTAITLIGFYLLGGLDWRRWLACLAGFVVARFVIKWLIKSRADRRPVTPS